MRKMKKTITIKGLHCKSCKVLIEDTVNDIDGVLSCKVDLKTGKTIIEYRDNPDFNRIIKEIESLGEYEVNV